MSSRQRIGMPPASSSPTARPLCHPPHRERLLPSATCVASRMYHAASALQRSVPPSAATCARSPGYVLSLGSFTSVARLPCVPPAATNVLSSAPIQRPAPCRSAVELHTRLPSRSSCGAPLAAPFWASVALRRSLGIVAAASGCDSPAVPADSVSLDARKKSTRPHVAIDESHALTAAERSSRRWMQTRIA